MDETLSRLSVPRDSCLGVFVRPNRRGPLASGMVPGVDGDPTDLESVGGPTSGTEDTKSSPTGPWGLEVRGVSMALGFFVLSGLSSLQT